ncbi:MAG TPA: hypothetical protein VIX63_14790 [Vicinamibacterales bacterium]
MIILATQRAELLRPFRWRARADGLGEGTVLCHARIDFLAVVEVVSERRVRIGER